MVAGHPRPQLRSGACPRASWGHPRHVRLTGHPAVISGDTPPDTAKDLNSNPHPTRSRTTLAGPCSLLSPRVLEGGIGVLILKRGSQAGRRGQGGQPWFPAQASTLRGPGCRLTLSVSKPSGLGAGSSRQRGLVCLRVRLPRWVPAAVPCRSTRTRPVSVCQWRGGGRLRPARAGGDRGLADWQPPHGAPAPRSRHPLP